MADPDDVERFLGGVDAWNDSTPQRVAKSEDRVISDLFGDLSDAQIGN